MSKKKKLNVVKLARATARAKVGPVPRTRRIENKRRKEKEKLDRSEILAVMRKLL